jgi:hypothetical protein
MPTPRPPLAALLLDLSGTLHVGSAPTPRAVQALQRLREAGVPFRFCSNTSKEGKAELAERLRGMGFEVLTRHHPGPGSLANRGDAGGEEELWTSLGAVGEAVRRLDVQRFVRAISIYIAFTPSASTIPSVLLFRSFRLESLFFSHTHFLP